MWAGLPCELEVFNFFSGLIPQAGLARMDKQRQQRQAMVLYIKINLTNDHGGSYQSSLARIESDQ